MTFHKVLFDSANVFVSPEQEHTILHHTEKADYYAQEMLSTLSLHLAVIISVDH